MTISSILDKFRQYPLAWVALIIWIVIVATIFLRNDVLGSLEIKENELSTRLRLIEGNAVSSKNLDLQTDELRESVDAMQERLFVAEKRAINTDYLYSFENDYNVEISEVTHSLAKDPSHVKGGPKELSQHSAIIYTLFLSTDYGGLMEYLHSLYHSEAFMRIGDMSISSSNTMKSNTEKLQVRLRLLVLSEEE
ncbi:MAG: hypothetical protein AAGC73_09620 [Verrucomicrobiota bacterium]